jgi:hypothetical protein
MQEEEIGLQTIHPRRVTRADRDISSDGCNQLNGRSDG